MRCALVLLFLFACKGGDPVTCEKACRNYAQLKFWGQADQEIAAAPVAQRDALRKQELAKFEHELERGIDVCATHCVSADNEAQNQCMIAARTLEQAKACDR